MNESMVQGWNLRKRPAGLDRRMEFEDYSAMRRFLDELAELCEREGYYPNISFGPRHVVVAIEADEAQQLTEARLGFARAVNNLVGDTAAA